MASPIFHRVLELFQPEAISQRFLRETVFQRAVTPPPFSQWPKSWVQIHFKSYPRARVQALPPVEQNTSMRETLTGALQQRRSCRSFDKAPLSLTDLSELLQYSVGIQTRHGNNWDFSKRMYPSGGARYPVEVYLVSLNSELPPGLYHYHFQTHSLECLGSGDFTEKLKDCYGDPWVTKSGVVLIFTGMFGRSEGKYGSRGLRHVFLEAGHMSQNVYLNATRLGLGCCAQGGHVDEAVNNILDIDGWNESVVHTMTIGSLPQESS